MPSWPWVTAAVLAAVAIARLGCHYVVNNAFLKDEQQILRDVPRIRALPGVIIHGRYDAVCPVEAAWALHEAWPEPQLRIVPDAGQIAYEPGITREWRALPTASDPTECQPDCC